VLERKPSSSHSFLTAKREEGEAMIDLFLKYAVDSAAGPELDAAVAKLIGTAGQGRTELVEAAELAVHAAKPGDAFAFDEDGFATLRVEDHVWHAGRFETPSIAELRERAKRAGSGSGRLRLWVLDGPGLATDVGGLQATAPPGSLFQAASQFNCLESPGPYVTPVVQYFRDYTQGPRASISAFPGTLLRHYAAPGTHGKRFVQTEKKQLNLLADVLAPEVAQVQSGYLMAHNVRDPAALLAALTDRFESIRVGVHEGVQVVLGYDFEGAVDDSENRRIAQVFTSTVAGGGYGGAGMSGAAFEGGCRQLLRAAYLGTLLAAATLGQRQAVLTLIGGGVFGNPVPLIWDAIRWAVAEVEPLLSNDLDVIVNGRNLGSQVPRESILAAVRERGGALLAFARTGLPTLFR
jgi:O-acetyl-ADP-ribose deacetylase (regulator of RNase III)